MERAYHITSTKEMNGLAEGLGRNWPEVKAAIEVPWQNQPPARDKPWAMLWASHPGTWQHLGPSDHYKTTTALGFVGESADSHDLIQDGDLAR